MITKQATNEWTSIIATASSEAVEIYDLILRWHATLHPLILNKQANDSILAAAVMMQTASQQLQPKRRI